MCRLQALHRGFAHIDAECRRRFQKSGTTATLAVLVGWELIVASVGDSVAYLDTGAEILQVRSDLSNLYSFPSLLWSRILKGT
jgi:serine/threonine protein phosphatase PrpC